MKIVKLYMKYFITFSNILILILLFSFLCCAFYLSIYNINDSLSYDEILQFYFENSIYYTKIIMVLLSTFLFMKLNGERNEYVLNIVITAGYNKKSNYKYMLIFNFIIIFSFCFMLLLMYLVIGFIVKEYFYFDNKYLIAFINIFILSIYYGLLSYFVTIMLKNQFVYLVIIIMFFVSTLFVENESVIKYIYLYFFPDIDNSNGLLYVNSLYLLIITFVLYYINKVIYCSKDLQN